MFDLNASIINPDEGDELDYDRLGEYIDGLMVEFGESSEAVRFQEEFNTGLGWAATYMDFAASYLYATPATITPSESNEVLFDIFPRKVSVEADAAAEIVGELRAFWEFLNRTRSVESASVILESLDEDGVDELTAELSDSHNFGMAKSFTMAGKKAGYDMTNQDDLNRFMIESNSSLLSGSPVPAGDGFANVQAAAPRRSEAATIRNTSRRVGRNDPCPCGSGRKYKKCCGP